MSGERLPIEGRIVALADVFDALCTARLYKSAWDAGEAAAELRVQSGRQFDPACVAAFERGCGRIAGLGEDHALGAPAA